MCNALVAAGVCALRPGRQRHGAAFCGYFERDKRAARRSGRDSSSREHSMATAAAGRQQPSQSSFFSATLNESDPELAGIVGRELKRQQDEIELIASENMVSRAVLETVGTVLTNKYAEGYPGNRYYGGCQYVD